ncbi:MAG: hypothetical protein GXP18_01410, partial [Gammaproteobacteria bacterium]|nr:hypothetical protein [Gammaproteobacteria bacterium]
MKIRILFPVVISLLLFLSACSSGSNSPDNNGTTQSGAFIDSPVGGLSYTSATRNGITDADGTFNYEENETVTFRIGDITLGSASGAAVVTPVDLVSGATSETDPVVTNIARFLQTLDDDENPDNGITISSAVSNLAANKNVDFILSTSDFENNGNVQTVVADLTAVTSAGARSLVTATQAQAHLNGTLVALLSGNYGGSFSGGDTGTFSITINNDGAITGTGQGGDGAFSITGTVNSNGTAAAGDVTTGAN